MSRSDRVSSGELGDFLRRRREALRPDQLPSTAIHPPGRQARRPPGLRREEVAALAGVPAGYYERLEQGSAPHPSPQVLAALGSALRLTADERDHLARLAAQPPLPPGTPTAPSTDKSPAPTPARAPTRSPGATSGTSTGTGTGTATASAPGGTGPARGPGTAPKAEPAPAPASGPHFAPDFRPGAALDPASDRVPVPAEARRMLDGLGPVPAYLVDARQDIVDWNAAAAELITDFGLLPAEERNTVRLAMRLRGTLCSAPVGDEDAFARRPAADLRTTDARRPSDHVLGELAAEFAAHSPEFAAAWREHDVRPLPTLRKHLHHPELGRLELDCHTLLIPATDLRLVLYTAAPDTPTATALTQLGLHTRPAPPE